MTGLVDALVTTDRLAEVFGDDSVIQSLVDVEQALVRAQARTGVIPPGAADVIGRVVSAGAIDAAALVRGARESGTFVIALVDMLTAKVRAVDETAAAYVHWGATSQDISDTALVTLVVRANRILSDDHAHLATSLRELSDRHANDVMLARTLLQPAPPITFGLKAAGWLAGTARSWARLQGAVQESSVVQFGGGSGTLAAQGPQALAVADALGGELSLPVPAAPWHAYGDRLAAVVTACGIYAGILGKIARDVSLLMQAEVAEAAEPGGGSSAMPHKRNPSGCARAIAAAARLTGLSATALAGLDREQERSAGLWHVEWPTVADAMQATGAALEAMRHVIAGLSVDPRRMRANVDAMRGTIFGERLVMAATPALGRDRAKTLVREAIHRAQTTGESLAKSVGRTPDLVAVLSAEDVESLALPERHLGEAEALRLRLITESITPTRVRE